MADSKADQAAQDKREAEVTALQLRLLDPADEYTADDALEERDDTDPSDAAASDTED